RDRAMAVPGPGEAVEDRLGRRSGIRLHRRVGEVELVAAHACLARRHGPELAKRSHFHATPAVRADSGNGTMLGIDSSGARTGALVMSTRSSSIVLPSSWISPSGRSSPRTRPNVRQPR